MIDTVVVNVHRDEYDVYIGRPGHGFDGYFGNTEFKIGRDGDRQEVIAKYKRWFWDRVNADPEFRSRVMNLRGKRLGCFCKPKACHGDVIVDWIEAGCPIKQDYGPKWERGVCIVTLIKETQS